MSAARSRTRFRHFIVLTVFASSSAGGRAADPPPVGTVRELPVLSVSVAVGSTDRETKRASYTPPPGWHVRSHRVAAANRTGVVSYAVGTVPAGWAWSADESSASVGRAAMAAGLTLPTGLTAGGQAGGAREGTASGRQTVTASHHALVVEVTARGCGLWQGGAGVDLTVFAELVYLGPASR